MGGDYKLENIGPFRGGFGERNDQELVKLLEDLPRLLQDRDVCQLISVGRHYGYILATDKGHLHIKAFGPQNLIKDWIDHSRGTKAYRTFLAAQHLVLNGVGTPEPVAFLERWAGKRLEESYLLTEYVGNISTFKDELNWLFQEDPDCSALMSLIETVACAIAQMHKAGFLHNDLGNQNILLRRIAPRKWGDVMFVDLNRGRIHKSLSDRQRARDISRIYLPSDILRVFKEMYFSDVPTPEFQRWESHYRNRYAFHSATRRMRHPIRYGIMQRSKDVLPYPPEKEMWIWDTRSVQPINVMRPRDRNRQRKLRHLLSMGKDALLSAPAVKVKYRELVKSAFSREIPLTGKVGVALEPAIGDEDREISLLQELGRIPVQVRVYAHKPEKERDRSIAFAKRLKQVGHSVNIALLQDRKSAAEPARWKAFLEQVLPQIEGTAEAAEVCHAVNRVKWGIWDFEEHRRMMEAVADARSLCPSVRLTGPAAIDFEYLRVMSALKRLPENFSFDVLSHHLYVDRRGAPENRQGSFSLLEKCALLRAVGAVSGRCGDEVWISEVNWPILGTGIYSPVNSPYVSPGQRYGDPSVNETDYAVFMLRYLLISLCSGMIDRVYWWRLVSRGFGLVDDSEASAWRKRPAFEALKRLLEYFDGAVFLGKERTEPGDYILRFAGNGGRKFEIMWSVSENKSILKKMGDIGLNLLTGVEEKLSDQVLLAVPRIVRS